jgi:biuret amidohydrolase
MKHAFGLHVPEKLEEICTPSRCALIVYDMQVGIVPQIAEGPAILNRCQQLLTAARAGGFRVFFMRHIFLPNRAAGVGQLRRAMVWQRKSDPIDTKPLITQGSPPWQIVSELAPQEDEVVIDKITMSAFEGTFLNLALRDAHLEAFIIAGIALEIGIEPTVRHGVDLNYIPIVVTDACGSKTQQLKERSLATLEETGEVITVDTTRLAALMKKAGMATGKLDAAREA